MRTGRLEDVATLVLSIAALGIAGTAVWQRLGSQSRTPRLESTSNWESYAFPGNEVGPPGAKVTIVEFSDFQCPYCAQASRALDELLEKYPKEIRLVFRHLPVAMTHEHAFNAATAAECAALQGQFKPYHDVLFASQPEIGRTEWTKLAERARIADTASFRNCVARQQTKARVEQDMDAARQLKIRGTPFLLINGQHLMTGDSTQIRKVVEAALK